MNQQQLHDLGQQFADALHAVDRDEPEAIDRIVALFSSDAQLTNSALTLAGTQREGQDGVRRFWAEYRQTFGDVETTFTHLTTDASAVGLFWTTQGTDTHGAAISYNGVSLLEYGDDGKISAFQGYYDTRQLSRTVQTEG